MTILERTDTRLVIEWRPAGHAWGWLAFTLAMTAGLVDRWPELRTGDTLMAVGAVALVVFMYVQVYKFAQVTHLVLDRDTGRVRILRRTIFGRRETGFPLSELTGTQITVVPSKALVGNILFLRRDQGGRTRWVAVTTTLFRGALVEPAALAIADWLDSARRRA